MIGCLMLLCAHFIQAQEVKIKFEQLQRDLIARTQPRLDLNDNPCAVIRVSAANTNEFDFEGNIVGEVIYNRGEALIYITQGSKSTFVPRIRCWNGNRRVEYLCKSYMHHGKEFCPSHRIRESELDARVQQYAEELRSQWQAEQDDLRRLHRLWEMKRPEIQAHIAELYDEIQRLEQEVDDLLLEKIRCVG